MKRIWAALRLPLFLIWLFAVLTFYYWGHQAALLPPALGLLRAGWLLAVVALLGLAALGPGLLLARLLRLPLTGPAEMLLLGSGLGGGVLALVALLLATAGLLQSAFLWPLALLSGAATLLYLLRRGRPSPPASRPGWDRYEWLLIVLLGVSAGSGLLLSLAPPVGWDGLSTHLVLVRAALDAGRLLAEPVFDRPVAGHLLYAWGMALGGDGLPQLLSYAMALLTGLATWLLGVRLFGRASALRALVVLFAVEVFVLTAAWPYVDLPLTWFATLALYALVRWLESERPSSGWVIAAALFTAMAIGVKANGLFLLPVAALLVGLGVWWRRDRWQTLLPGLAAAGAGGAGLLAIWWLVERQLRPAGTAIAGVSSAAATLGESAAAGPPLAALAAYGRTVWNLTIIGQQGSSAFDGAITPLFLMLTPLFFLLPRRGRLVNALAATALLQFLLWLLFPQFYYQSRHLMIGYPLFALLAAYTIGRLGELDQPWFTLSGFYRLILLLVIGLQALFYLGWLTVYDPLPYVLGYESRDAYLTKTLNGGTSAGYYSMMLALEDVVAETDLVGFATPEPRTFYCPADCRRINFSDRDSSDALAAQMAAAELDYLLVSWGALRYGRESNAEQPDVAAAWQAYERALRSALAENGAPVASAGDFELFRLLEGR